MSASITKSKDHTESGNYALHTKRGLRSINVQIVMRMDGLTGISARTAEAITERRRSRMITRVMTCDRCKKPCSETWFTVYRNKGDYYNGKVEGREDICLECYTKMLAVLIER